jgi:hypothetical protein
MKDCTADDNTQVVGILSDRMKTCGVGVVVVVDESSVWAGKYVDRLLHIFSQLQSYDDEFLGREQPPSSKWRMFVHSCGRAIDHPENPWSTRS